MTLSSREVGSLVLKSKKNGQSGDRERWKAEGTNLNRRVESELVETRFYFDRRIVESHQVTTTKRLDEIGVRMLVGRVEVVSYGSTPEKRILESERS